MRNAAALAISLLSLSSAAMPVQAQPPSLWFHPVWIAVPAGNPDETVTLNNPDYLTLFKLRPLEGYGLVDPAVGKGGKKLLAAGAYLIRVPGPSFVACEAIRPKGNERFTCLLDEDLDGDFDQVHRPGAATNLFIEPLQYYKPKFDPLPASVRYRGLDEKAEFPASEFIMQYSVQGKLNIVRFCFEPYRRKASWGVPHLVDDCLTQTMIHKRGELPYPFSKLVHGNQITILSFDETTKAMTFRVRRIAAELPITFGWEQK